MTIIIIIIRSAVRYDSAVARDDQRAHGAAAALARRIPRARQRHAQRDQEGYRDRAERADRMCVA